MIILESLPKNQFRVVELHNCFVTAIGTVFSGEELSKFLSDHELFNFIVTMGLLHRSHIESDELERQRLEEEFNTMDKYQ